MASKNHKLIYTSSPDRGLDILLTMWPEILKKFPDATLDFAYGWEVYDLVTVGNPERLQWKKDIVEALKQKGITDHGRIGKDALKKLRDKAGIWAYPTYFTEIFCINAIEMQESGVVPVTMDLGSLKEVTGAGVLVKGDIYQKSVQAEYLKELLALIGDSKRWELESKKAKKFAKKFSWFDTAYKWGQEFSRKDPQDLKVTIYTPTIRKGFWNLMSKNLSQQTYKNFEWLIVDDFPEDRSKIAQKYAKMYGLDIRYCRGRARKIKRNYGLVNADNTALGEAKGELLVFLQDFILISPTAIEELVRLHKKNPDALLAPCDVYYRPSVKPDITKEDWFDGETNVVGEFAWQNPRITGIGLRETNNPFEFEMNWGAIPVKIGKELGGFYEFFDFGLGFNNTDIALRALKAGYRIIVDDTNIATCIDHWEALRGKNENGGMERARRLNDPLFLWEMEMIKLGKLPIFRKQEVDDKINLQFTVPKEVDDMQMKDWIKENGPSIAQKWLEEYKDVKLSG